MKRCPECGREYDNTMMFCLDDGAELLYGPATASDADEPATAILHSTAAPGEAPTRAQINTTNETAILPEVSYKSPTKTASRKNSLIAGVLGILLVTGLGIGSYLYYGRGSGKQINSIAVMPFVNESGNADVEYLSDGMTETLIKSLSELPNLNVKPRSSVFRYKGKDTDLKTIGKELNVEAILNGRVIQRGDQLTLSLELIDVQNDKVLWTESYQRKQSDLVSLQSEIARDVSTKLKSKLSGADEAKVTKTSTVNPEAYQAYLKGRYYWNKRTSEDMKKAVEQFDLAVQKDPNYALAYVGLADCYGLAETYLKMPLKESLPKAKAYATKALEIDNSLGEAYATLGLINQNSWNWAEAEKAFKRSVELNPNYATARLWYSRSLAVLGRKDEAFAEIKRANEIDPLWSVIMSNVSQRYEEMGDYQSAIEQYRKLAEIDQSWSAVHWQLANVYLYQKRPAEALAEAEKVRDSLRTTVFLGMAYAQLERRNEALAMIKILEERFAKGEERAATDIARVYVELGDKEKTFEWLEKAFQVRDAELPWFRLGPTFDAIRDDPRYKDLLKRMGLPE